MIFPKNGCVFKYICKSLYRYLVIVAIYKSFYPFGMNFYGRQPDVIGEVLNGVCNNI